MESAAPFTRDFHPLDNARAEHTSSKRIHNTIITDTLTFLGFQQRFGYSAAPNCVVGVGAVK